MKEILVLVAAALICISALVGLVDWAKRPIPPHLIHDLNGVQVYAFKDKGDWHYYAIAKDGQGVLVTEGQVPLVKRLP